jgi:Abortive infection C-terminus
MGRDPADGRSDRVHHRPQRLDHRHRRSDRRLDTSLHGHLQYLCDGAGIDYDKRDDATTALLKKLRREHPQLQDLGPRSQDIEKVLNAAGAMLDALTPVRNNASLAHPNKDLIGRDEAQLVVNAGRTLLAYLDAKIGTE